MSVPPGSRPSNRTSSEPASPRIVGAPVARELIYTGRYVDAERALAIGLVSGVAPDSELLSAADELIDEPSSCADLRPAAFSPSGFDAASRPFPEARAA